jgi:hypothetical protein
MLAFGLGYDNYEKILKVPPPLLRYIFREREKS